MASTARLHGGPCHQSGLHPGVPALQLLLTHGHIVHGDGGSRTKAPWRAPAPTAWSSREPIGQLGRWGSIGP